MDKERQFQIAMAIVRLLVHHRVQSSGLESLSGKCLVKMAEDVGVTTGEICDFLEPVVRDVTTDLLDKAFFKK